MSDYARDRWEQIKALRPSIVNFTRYDHVPKRAQGEGRNGRKAAARAGLARKHWPRVK